MCIVTITHVIQLLDQVLFCVFILATFKHQFVLKHIKALTCSCPKHMVQKLSMFYKYCHDVMSFGYVKQYMSTNVQYVINVLVNVYMSKTTRFSQVANRQKTNYCQYICHMALLRFFVLERQTHPTSSFPPLSSRIKHEYIHFLKKICRYQ